MEMYTLTVFAKSGEKLLDESFEAETEQDAKRIAEEKLAEQQFEQHTHRCTSAKGKLVVFHS